MLEDDHWKRHLNSIWEAYQILGDEQDLLESLKVLIKVKEKRMQ